MESAMGVFLKTMFFYVLKLLLVPLRILPVKKKRILFTGLTGGKTNEYSCNLKYLCEYLEEKEPGRFEICWAVSEPENYRFLQEKRLRHRRLVLHLDSMESILLSLRKSLMQKHRDRKV